MSAHGLLNVSNKLGKRDKMRVLLSTYLFFGMILINSIIQEHLFIRALFSMPLVVCRFYCMAFFHSMTRRHMVRPITNNVTLYQLF